MAWRQQKVWNKAIVYLPDVSTCTYSKRWGNGGNGNVFTIVDTTVNTLHCAY